MLKQILTQGYVYLFLERQKEWGERERERERETLMWERSIDQLPPAHAPTEDQTHNRLAYGTALQPSEPPGQGWNFMFLKISIQ